MTLATKVVVITMLILGTVLAIPFVIAGLGRLLRRGRRGQWR